MSATLESLGSSTFRGLGSARYFFLIPRLRSSSYYIMPPRVMYKIAKKKKPIKYFYYYTCNQTLSINQAEVRGRESCMCIQYLILINIGFEAVLHFPLPPTHSSDRCLYSCIKSVILVGGVGGGGENLEQIAPVKK